MSAKPKPKGLIASVGGSLRPIVATIKVNEPEHILFVASETSREEIESGILPRLSAVPQYETLTLTDYENMGTCYREIRDYARGWLERRGLTDEEVCVDNTGGTKIMSSALALAGVERFNDFAYVSGEREGLSVVVDGTETVINSRNPWNQYAARDLERANWLLAQSQAHAAANLLSEAANKCDAEFKSKIRGFANLAKALGESDMFRFRNAVNEFNRARGDGLEHTIGYAAFQDMAALADGWREIDAQTKASDKTPGRETMLELLANAERRARQSRYDDATGRLYRAVELRGQQLLRDAFGAELGKPRLDHFPQDRLADAAKWLQGVAQDDNGRYLMGVRRVYEALRFSEDPGARARAADYDRLDNHLTARNDSLLAHGLTPVTEKTFNAFWDTALDVLEVRESEIPRWPKLELTL